MKRLIYILPFLLLLTGFKPSSDGYIIHARDINPHCDKDTIIGRVLYLPKETERYYKCCLSEDECMYKPKMSEVVLVEQLLRENEDTIRSKNPYLKTNDEWLLAWYFRQYLFTKFPDGHCEVVIQLLLVEEDSCRPPFDDFCWSRENMSKWKWAVILDGADSVVTIRIDLTNRRILSVGFNGCA